MRKGVALARLGRSSEALREVERSVEVAEAAGLPGAACRGYTNLSAPTRNDPARRSTCAAAALKSRRGAIGDLGFQRVVGQSAVAASSPTGAPMRACRPPRGRSRSTARSTSASICRCR